MAARGEVQRTDGKAYLPKIRLQAGFGVGPNTPRMGYNDRAKGGSKSEPVDHGRAGFGATSKAP